MSGFISYLFSFILFTAYAHTTIHSSEQDFSEYNSHDLPEVYEASKGNPAGDYEFADFYVEKKNIKKDKKKKFEKMDLFESVLKNHSHEKSHHDTDSDSNQALLTLESGPSAVVANCVNAISGDFFDSNLALTTYGPQPLVVQCSYCSSSKEWNFHHLAGLEIIKTDGKNHFRGIYYDDNGSSIAYQIRKEDRESPTRKFLVHKNLFEKGLTNCGSGEICAQTNWRNSSISCVGDSQYELKHGSGIRRLFEKGKNATKGAYRLEKETHSNGNQLRYSYDEGRLTKVKAFNKNGILLEQLDQLPKKTEFPRVNKKDEGKKAKWTSSTGFVEFSFEDEDNKLIKTIRPSNTRDISYEYDDHKRIIKKKLPEKQFLEISYHKNGDFKGRVEALKSPERTTHTFGYEKGRTKVVDAKGNLTEYWYDNSSKRLKNVVRYDNKRNILSQDSFHWSTGFNSCGNLRGRTFADSNKTYFHRKLIYDDKGNGNIKKDCLYGNLTGTFLHPLEVTNGLPSSLSEIYIKTFDYYYEDLDLDNVSKNLLSKEDDGRKIISYGYHPNTNLLTHRFTQDGDKIIKREFFNYDDNGVLIEETWDDGSSSDKDNFNNAKERHKKVITPRDKAPIGLPAIITEYYWDSSNSVYALLKKTINTHNLHGKIEEQEHYGSDDTVAYKLSWKYDRLGNVVEKVDAEGYTTFYKYDDNGNKTYEAGPLKGWSKTYIYDVYNCLRNETEAWPDGSSHTITHEYNDLNQRISTVDAFGQETLFTYNALGHLTSTESPKFYISPNHLKGPIEKTEYDALGCPIIKHDAKGHVTTTDFTIRGKPYHIKYHDGSQEKKEYSLDGLLAKEIAKNGLTTSYTYDCLGRVTHVVMTDLQGIVVKQTSSTYSTFHLMTETDENGFITLYDYNGAGRRISKTKGDHVTLYEYDSLGRIIRTTDSIDGINSRITCKTYDNLNRVKEERIEDSNNNVFSLEEYEYDANGNRTRVTVHTQAGKAITKTKYNPDGKPRKIINALGKKTIFEYDFKWTHNGQTVLKITKTDPLGNQEIKIHDTHGNVCCQMQRDPFGKIIQEENTYRDLLGQKTSSLITVYHGQAQDHVIETEWHYDSMGNMFKSIEAKGTADQKIIINHFNSYGEKYQIDMPNGFHITNEYDILGRLSTYTSSDKSIHYTYEYDLKDNPKLVNDLIHNTFTMRTYDDYNRLESETLDNGLVLKYTYDQLDRPLTVTLPDLTSISYRYNAHQLIAVERIKDNAITYTHEYKQYDLAGNVLEECLLENAGKITYEYDLLGRCVSVQAPHWKETILPDGFDTAGNLLKREVTDKQGSVTYTYTYDNLYQLTSENGFVSHSYENDSIYNRIEKDSEPYDVNHLNQLLSQTGNKYDYDKNGNLKTKTSNNEKTIYSYDALDRLTKVDDGTNVTTYTYDSFHRRLSKTNNGIETKYFYHNQNEIGAYAEGIITQLRVLGLSYGAEIGAAVAFELDGNTYAPINDPLGSVVALLDKEDNVVESYRYTAFGEMDDSIHTVDNPWLFSSKRFDPETGFIYFGRRYYAPDIGRWITPDPAGYADGPNLYAYVHNHPLAYIDPDGQLAFLLAPLAISLAIDLLLPSAITYITPYVGVMAGGFLMGVAQGYNLDFTPAALDPSSLACQQAGIALGALLNLRPTKMAGNAFKCVTNLGTDILKKEAMEAAGNVVASNLRKVFTWSKPQRFVSQATQKTAQVAENSIARNTLNVSRGAESVNAGLKLNRKLASLEIAGGHAFEKHASEFGFKTTNQMASHIEEVLTNPTLMRRLSNGRTAFWHNPTGSIVIRNPKALDGGTAFVPKTGINYFNNGIF